jgi:hypothetical protein
MIYVCQEIPLQSGCLELTSSFSSIASSIPYNMQSPLASSAVVLAQFRILGWFD